MTTAKSKVTRQVRGTVKEAGKDREVIVTVYPSGVLGFRAKGCRREYQLTAECCYVMAVKAHVAEEKRACSVERKVRLGMAGATCSVQRRAWKKG